MNVQVENLEKNMAKLTIELPEDMLEKALQAVYLKQRKQINIPGFRKGKVPRNMIEKMYGPAIFYEDAANRLIQENYASAMEESGVEIVSKPMIEVEQIEKGKPFIFTAEVAVKPPVKLGNYKGVTVTEVDLSVSDKEVDEAVERERNNNARTVTVEDRPIQKGDTAVIDFEGFVDGIPFEGGKGENHPLEIGSHTFVEDFEEQLIGKSSGEETEVNVTFPEEYQAKDLAGKPALFRVKIHEVKAKELPDLDDEFAQDVSEFDTLEEYREDVKAKLAEQKKESAKRIQEDEAVRKIVADSTMEIPDAMVDFQVDSMVNEYAQQVALQGVHFEDYLRLSGTTMDGVREQARPDAVSRIQSSLVLEEIVKQEKIEVTEEDVDARVEKIAKLYGMDAAKMKETLGEEEKESMKKDISIQKALDLVLEHSVEQPKDEPKDEKAE